MSISLALHLFSHHFLISLSFYPSFPSLTLFSHHLILLPYRVSVLPFTSKSLFLVQSSLLHLHLSITQFIFLKFISSFCLFIPPSFHVSMMISYPTIPSSSPFLHPVISLFLLNFISPSLNLFSQHLFFHFSIPLSLFPFCLHAPSLDFLSNHPSISQFIFLKFI